MDANSMNKLDWLALCGWIKQRAYIQLKWIFWMLNYVNAFTSFQQNLVWMLNIKYYGKLKEEWFDRCIATLYAWRLTTFLTSVIQYACYCFQYSHGYCHWSCLNKSIDRSFFFVSLESKKLFERNNANGNGGTQLIRVTKHRTFCCVFHSGQFKMALLIIW